MPITFNIVHRGEAEPHGNFDAPSGAMARGIGIVRSNDTVAEAAVGDAPYGFLDSKVTVDGPKYEERMHISIDSTIFNEVKVSDGKIRVIPYVPGVEYAMKGNVEGGTTFAKGNQVFMAASGEFANLANANVGDVVLGVVQQIDITVMGEDNCIIWQAVANLGTKVS